MRGAVEIQAELSSVALKPRQCPQLRLDMIRAWEPNGSAEQFLRKMVFKLEPDREYEYAVWDRRSQLRTAELWWVSPGMVELVCAAANTLPEDLDSVEFYPNALCVFGYPVARDIDPDLPIIPTDILHWHGTFCDSYMRTAEGQLLMPSSSDSRCDDTISAPFNKRMFMALHALMASPGVTDTVRELPDRGAARRSLRAGVEDPSVRVIYMRGSRSTTLEQHEAEAGRYRHQWIVSGHWRKQAHGPARSLRRLTWVSPYLKGPADAPLLTGERVKALVR